MDQKFRKLGKVRVPLGERVGLKEGQGPFQGGRVTTAEALGTDLKLRRKELGYTQATAAMLCNHSVRVISEIENGRPTVGVGIILDYALALGVDVNLVLRGC